jgi:hypothetical protein
MNSLHPDSVANPTANSLGRSRPSSSATTTSGRMVLFSMSDIFQVLRWMISPPEWCFDFLKIRENWYSRKPCYRRLGVIWANFTCGGSHRCKCLKLRRLVNDTIYAFLRFSLIFSKVDIMRLIGININILEVLIRWDFRHRIDRDIKR